MHRFCWKRALTVIALAAIACVSLGGGMLAALLGGSSDRGSVFAEEPPVATPFREYTAIDCDYAQGYDGIYRGVTTVRGLKNNLIVRGTINPEGNFTDSETFTLSYDEYVIVAGGEVKADNYILAPGTATEPSIAITLSCGSATVDIMPNVLAEPPKGEGEITISMPATITDDHTAESLLQWKNEKGEPQFQVKEADGTVIRSDRYTVFLTYSGSSALVQVSTVGNRHAEAKPNVTSAQPVGVDLRPRSGLAQEGGYYKWYKGGDDKTAYDAFVKGATPEDIFRQLSVTAIYPFSRAPLTLLFNEQNQLSGAIRNGNSVEISTTTTLATEEAIRTVDVRLGSYSASLSLNFAPVTVVKIDVDTAKFFAALPSTINAYTVLNPANFISAVTLWENTGEKKSTVIADDILFIGSLAPTADAMKTLNKGDKYPRDIQIQSTANERVVSEKITIENIQFEAPLSISNTISSTNANNGFAPQTMHHDFDYSGLTVQFTYDEDGENTVVANLEDFKGSEYLETTLYTSETDLTATQTGVVVTKETKRARIRFSYNGIATNVLNGTISNGRLTVNKDPVDVPEINTNAVIFSEDCNKPLAGSQLIYGTKEGHNLKMSVAVCDAGGTAVEDTVAYYSEAENKIVFRSGGTFFVKVSLGTDTVSAEEYTLRYAGTSSSVSVDTEGRYVTYKITINKGTIAVSPDPISDELYYGDTAEPAVKGTVGGITYKLVNQEGGTVETGSLAVPFKYVYLPADADNYDPADYDYESYDVTGKSFWNSTANCLHAGKYHVYAVTKSTTAYLASKSRAGKYAEIEILPKEIDVTAPTEYVFTRGASRGASDFITARNFVTGDRAEAVLAVYNKGTTTAFTSKTHKGEYNVTVSINSAFKSDYVLKGNKTSQDATFKITQRELEFAAAWASGFTYGASGADPNPGHNEKDAAHFYAQVKLDGYYPSDASGEITGAKIDNTDFPEWAIGHYVAKYVTEYDPTYPDEKTNEDYTLPDITAHFEITAAGIVKIGISGNNWSTASSGGSVGSYSGSAIETALDNWAGLGTNLAPDGTTPIVTVTIDGVRLAPDEATTFTVSHDGTSKFAVTEAGAYTVTIRLNKNYVWSGENNADDIVYYGTVNKAWVTGWYLPLSDNKNLVYNGEAQEQKVRFILNNNGSAIWNKDVLKIVSVVGTSHAAENHTLASEKIDNTNGTFAVTYAGNYTVTVALADKLNYQWWTGDTEDKSNIPYTVDRAPLVVQWDGAHLGAYQDLSYPFVEGATEQQIPTRAPFVGYEADRENLALTKFTIYSDAACTQSVGTKVTAAGTYYIKITAFGDAGSISVYKNYLPISENRLEDISIKFVISSKGLETPVLTGGGTSVTVVYGDDSHGGDGYKFSDFISNITQLVDVNNNRIVITVADSADLEGNDPFIKNVYLKEDVVTAYTVKITPAANYKWESFTADEREEKEFTILIQQRVVAFEWKKDGTSGNFVYDGTTKFAPEVDFKNKLTGDDVELTVSDGSTEAGVHTVNVFLSGDRQDNYTLTGAATSTSASFTVKKQVLTAPSRAVSGTLTYDERIQTVAYSSWASVYNGKVTAAVVGVNGNAGVPEGYKNLGSCAFDSAKGELTLLHAGTYTVTFTLNEEARKNYCWTEGKQTAFTEGVETDCTDSVIVNRKTLTAPALGTERALEWNGEVRKPANIQSGNTVQGVKYSVSYGTYTSDGGFSEATTPEPAAPNRKTVYYVKLTIDPDNNTLAVSGASFSPYDYVWEENAKDNNVTDAPSMGYVKAIGGVYGANEYNEKGVSMMLCYVITFRQVGADFEFQGYTFGDNGYLNGEGDASRTFLPSGALKFNDLVAGNGYKLFYKQSSLDIYKDTLSAIEAANPTVTVVFRTGNSEKSPEVSAENLVNGLPWNNGTYYAHIAVGFKDSDNLNNFSGAVEFTVAQRRVSVEWSEAASAVYNGNEQTRGTTVTNVYKKDKTVVTSAEIPELTVDKVTNVKYTGGTVAAHTVNITGVNDGNYTVEGLTNKSAPFTITPKEIAVIGTDVAGHVYGDAITDRERAFTLASGYVFCDGGTYIRVRILKADGTEVTALDGVGGTYRVVPELIYAQGNYTLTNADGESLVTEGTFTVVKREITVSIGKDTNGDTLATSAYGATPVDVDAKGIWVATVNNGANAGSTVGIPAGETAKVFTLSAQVDATSPVSTDKRKYYITCTDKNDTNYTVTFLENTWEYVITPAAITNVAVSGYRHKYDAAAHDILSVSATAVGGMRLDWYYSEDGESWTPYKVGDGAAKTKIRNVAKFKYYVKVTADNHADYIYRTGSDEKTEVTVEVTQETLTVSVNLSIVFGEVGPDKYSGTDNVWYQEGIANLRTESSIYTVTGFAGADDGAAERELFYKKSADGAFVDFYGLDGKFSYAYKDGANTYAQGKNKGTYILAFVIPASDGLNCGNYRFVGADGALTVKPLPVVVAIDDYTAKFNQPDPPVPDVASVVTERKSSYDRTSVITYTIPKSIVTITNPALTSYNGATTNKADTYDITITLNDDNYVLDGEAANGGYKTAHYVIMRAANEITTAAKDGLFTQAYSTTNVNEVSEEAWVYGNFDATSAPDGYFATGKQALNDFAMLCNEEALTVTLYRGSSGTEALGRVLTIPAGTSGEAATAQIKEWFEAIYNGGAFGAGEYRVSYHMDQTENYEAFELSFYFKVGKRTLTITPTNFSVEYGTALPAVTEGLHSNNYPFTHTALVQNGFGADKAVDALGDIVTFELFSAYVYNTYENGSVGTYAVSEQDVQHKSLWDNYAVTFGEGTLTVTPRAITVAIIDQTHHYNLIGAYDTALQSYQTEAVETYQFRLTEGAFAAQDVAEAQDNWNAEGGVAFTAQKVFLLVSDALKHGADAKTNTVKKYPVYLAANQIGAKGEANYTITLQSPSYIGNEGIPADALAGGKAGTHEIKKAQIHIAVEGPFKTFEDGKYKDPYNRTEGGDLEPDAKQYDGNFKYYRAATRLPDGVNVAISSHYYGWSDGGYNTDLGTAAPKNAGSYEVRFETSDTVNYESATASQTFAIAARTFIVKTPTVTNNNAAVNGAPVFNGAAYTYAIEFDNFVEGEQLNVTLGVKTTLKKEGPDKDAFLIGDGALTDTGKGYMYTATNAGKYEVTITLQDGTDGNAFLASNYRWYNVSTGNNENSYTFTLDIGLQGLAVSATAATVQYGDELSDSSFKGYRPIYLIGGVDVEKADSAAKALFDQELAKGNVTLPFALGTFTKDEALFESDYTVKTSSWAQKTYNLRLKLEKLTAYNFDIVDGVTARLTVVARKIEITVKGYGDGLTDVSCTYDGQSANHNNCLQTFLNTYANRAKMLSVTNGAIAADNAPSDYSSFNPLMAVDLAVSTDVRNASSIPVRPTKKTTGYDMYDITFRNAKGDEISATTADTELLPTYEILKKQLTVRVGYYDNGTFRQEITVPYGSALTFGSTGNYTLRWEGFVNEGEGTVNGPDKASSNNVRISECTVLTADGTAYAAWKSNAGSTFTVTPVLTEGSKTLEFDNYSITLDTATLTVDKLNVTAVAGEVTYTEKTDENGIIYNGGISGIEHEISLTFAGVENELTKDASSFVYQTVYDTTGSDADGAQKAPTKVGSYSAWVTLDRNGNYRFQGVADGVSQKFTHVVKQKDFSLDWTHSGFALDAEHPSASNTANYISSMMTIVSFNHQSGGASTDILGAGYHTITPDKQLDITVTGLGSYELTVEFTEAAKRNYYWHEDDKAARRSITFTVASSDKAVTLTITAEDREYLTDSDPTYELKNAFGNKFEAVITYTYVSVEEGKFGTTSGALTADQVQGLSFTGAVPQNAGWYVVCGSYGGSSEYLPARAYYCFQITKKSVGKDDISFTTTDTVYTGMQLSATVGYDTRVVYVTSFDGEGYAPNAAGSSLRATNAGNYKIVLGLRDAGNYAWDPALDRTEGFEVTFGEDDEIISVGLTWKVDKASDNVIIWDEHNVYSITYGETYAVNARSTYSASVLTRYAVNDGRDWKTIPENEWMNVRQSDAGSYYVKIIDAGNDRNYTPAEDCKELVIAKSEITVTPAGSLVYGQAFAEGAFDYAPKAGIELDSSAQIEYKLVDGSLNEDNLNVKVGGYALTMDTDSNGFVKGLKSRNYNIKVAEGTLTVTPMAVTVQIGNKSGVYLDSDRVSVDDVSVSPVGAWSGGDLKTALGIALSTDVRTDSSVGSYAITGAATNGNYNVTFRNGTYTVSPLVVRVEISAGGGEYGKTITEAQVEHIYTTNATVNKDLGKGALQFLYNYSGRSNGGVTVNGSACPTLAGMYVYTVTGIKDNANYVLSSVASVSFVISKQEIDAGAFNVPSQPYAAAPLTPEVEENDYSALYEKMPHGDFVKAGTHSFYLRLTDFNNYKWKSVDVAEREMQFVITKAENMLVGGSPSEAPTIVIEGWQYGSYNAAINKPWAQTKFGSENIVYEFATSPEEDAEWTNAIPADGNAGTYWVRVTVYGTDNYEPFVSKSVSFVIAQVKKAAPELAINDGNRTYTGEELCVSVLGVDNRFMEIVFGSIATIGGGYQLKAVNAGTYIATVQLKDTTNYCWADGTPTDGDGNAILTWVVGRKKIAFPTENKNLFVVNGSILQYFPEGFDAELMTITGNEAGYGGTFTATVSLIDTQNFEWEDGTTGSIDFVWNIVGSSTVFTIIISVLSGASGAAAIVAAVQFVRFRKKKLAEAAGPQDDDSLADGGTDGEESENGGEQA